MSKVCLLLGVALWEFVSCPFTYPRTRSLYYSTQNLRATSKAFTLRKMSPSFTLERNYSRVSIPLCTQKVSLRSIHHFSNSHRQPSVVNALNELGVQIRLSSRLDLSSLKSKSHTVRTMSGETLAADLLLLCTGQTPNTGLLKDVAPDTIDETKQAHVLRTLQLAPIPPVLPDTNSDTDSDDVASLLAELGLEPDDTSSTETETPYENIFVIGDAADAFGAIKAGHNAYFQGEVAARNILRLIDGDDELERYQPGEPAIKVSLGLVSVAFFTLYTRGSY